MLTDLSNFANHFLGNLRTKLPKPKLQIKPKRLRFCATVPLEHNGLQAWEEPIPVDCVLSVKINFLREKLTKSQANKGFSYACCCEKFGILS